MNKDLLCPICGSSEKRFLTDTVRFGKKADVYKCAECTLAFIDQASFKFPENFYEAEYHQTYLTHVEPAAFDPEAYYAKMMKSTKIWADKFRGMLKGDEVVLDVGCSTGHFMDMVKDKTKKIYGSELNKKEIDFCVGKRGLDVSSETLTKRFKDGQFDYITMIYVLEHIAEPVQFLQTLKRLLKPGGALVILVPNEMDALLNLYDIPEFRSFYYCIEHIFYYNSSTIKRLFERVGLISEVEIIQEYPITNHLSWAYRRKPGDVLASRAGTPDAALLRDDLGDEWVRLWKRIDGEYKEFLKKNAFGDRLWCVAHPA